LRAGVLARVMDPDSAVQRYVAARRNLVASLGREHKDAQSVCDATKASAEKAALKRVARVESFLATEAMYFRMYARWWRGEGEDNTILHPHKQWEAIRHIALNDEPVTSCPPSVTLAGYDKEMVKKYTAWWMCHHYHDAAVGNREAVREKIGEKIRRTLVDLTQ
jgi:hypothetical protein